MLRCCRDADGVLLGCRLGFAGGIGCGCAAAAMQHNPVAQYCCMQRACPPLSCAAAAAARRRNAAASQRACYLPPVSSVRPPAQRARFRRETSASAHARARRLVGGRSAPLRACGLATAGSNSLCAFFGCSTRQPSRPLIIVRSGARAAGSDGPTGEPPPTDGASCRTCASSMPVGHRSIVSARGEGPACMSEGRG